MHRVCLGLNPFVVHGCSSSGQLLALRRVGTTSEQLRSSYKAIDLLQDCKDALFDISVQGGVSTMENHTMRPTQSTVQ